jgi:hypothetical protein
MLGDSTQGVGFAASAKAGVVSAVSATIIKTVLAGTFVILHAPEATVLKNRPQQACKVLNKSRTRMSGRYDHSVRLDTR